MLKRILPWAFSIALLAYLAWTTDLDRVWDAFRRVPLGWFAALAVLGTLVAFFYDTLCLTLVIRRFNAPVRFGEMLPLKGASYLLNIVNYNAAMGGMALYLRRVRGVSFLETASSLLFMNVLDVFVLCALVGVGLVVTPGGPALSPAAREGLAYVVAGFGLLLAGTWVYWNAGFDYFVLGRLRSWRIFHAFRHARLRDYGWLMALRLPMVLVYITVAWLYALLFGFDVPYPTMVLLQPVVIFVGTIPITVAGLGTSQVVMRSIYAPFATYLGGRALATPLLAGAAAAPALALPGVAPAAALAAGGGAIAAAAQYYDPTPLVDAVSTGLIFSIIIVRVAIGYAFLGRVSRAFSEGGAAAPSQDGDVVAASQETPNHVEP